MEAAAVLAAILALLHPAPDALALERQRLAPLADAITAAAEADGAQLPWPGPSARDGAELALVAIAWHESRFRADVIDCRRRGPAGDATAFQLLGPFARGGHSVAELCGSLPLAASRALAVLSAAAHACPHAGGIAAFQGYASGRCGRPAGVVGKDRNGEPVILDADAGATRCATWERLARREGVAGATCWARPFLAPIDG